MELLQLRYFYESACKESITKTARSHLVPPSSVSLAIKRLEQELGCSLFDRSGNRIRLNSNGRILQKALAVALPELDSAVEALAGNRPDRAGDIRLLVRSDRQFLLDCIMAFRKAWPGAVFHLSHDFNTENMEQFDIIIDAASADYGGFEAVPIIREGIRIAASEENPLCSQSLTLRQLRDQPFITMYKGSSMQRITVECCQKAGFYPNIIIESDDPLYLRKYIELDFGLAFVPELSWRGQLGHVRFLDVTDFHEERVTYAYRNRSGHLSPAALAFFNMLLEKRIVE